MIARAEKDDTDMATLIALAATTGARRGELLGLRWGDVDFDVVALTIERSVASISRGNLVTKDTKTHQARPIALDDFSLEVLRRQRKGLGARATDLGTEVTDATPVLTYDLKRPIGPDTASHYGRAVADKAGVDCHFHSLRHFPATQLVGGGHDVRTVAGRLGHANANTTLKVYAHALPERDRAAAAALGAALRQPV
jgi:integrase